MGKRGRPPKNKVEDIENVETLENDTETIISDELKNDIETKPEEVSETEATEGTGTKGSYNPFDESVIQREYSTPKIADSVTEEIYEPSFTPPSYEDIISQRKEEEPKPEGLLDNLNPEFNELGNAEKRFASENLVDFILDTYKRTCDLGVQFVQLDHSNIAQKVENGEIDLNHRMAIDNEGNSITFREFIPIYNQDVKEALQYDEGFGHKVRPIMIRVFIKNGWGMTDNNTLYLEWGKEVGFKLMTVFSLKKQLNTLISLQQPNNNQEDEPMEVEEIEDEPQPQRQRKKQKTDTQKFEIEYPNKPEDKLKDHPKEVQQIMTI